MAVCRFSILASACVMVWSIVAQMAIYILYTSLGYASSIRSSANKCTATHTSKQTYTNEKKHTIFDCVDVAAVCHVAPIIILHAFYSLYIQPHTQRHFFSLYWFLFHFFLSLFFSPLVVGYFVLSRVQSATLSASCHLFIITRAWRFNSFRKRKKTKEDEPYRLCLHSVLIVYRCTNIQTCNVPTIVYIFEFLLGGHL